MRTCAILPKAYCNCKKILKTYDQIHNLFMSKYTLTLEMITISNYHAGYVGNEE
jgi:hypothetical protein